ncbi:hypothetical protein BOTBODRAFT_437715 [Botryobasidium botryosum FD-172 SS1]|uniref:DUF202 domain-containing protein n=1 Tax=Botryobasidium botryosum (strain FD-172 SS1) TaxID=930990 RepID=A0A067N5J6_BOTB1|nr:hypothetical protein BOTBODRAFT_437715 [Botryobasidium botryosum FD-172 SS1]
MASSPTTYGHAPEQQPGLIRRSLHVVSDLFSPFSADALATLPRNPQGFRARSTRTDRIPEASEDGAGAEEGSSHTNYGATSATAPFALPPGVRIPKKVATPIKVEAKVWFANERTWISYLNISLLLGTLSLALFNASNDSVARNFAITYAIISVGVIVYGYVTYQKRITMIRKRDPGFFDEIIGPVFICIALFFAILSNFVIRVQELRRRIP